MDINRDYDERRHTLIKHELLRSYLEKLLFVVGRGGVKQITYVDCFSGPWSQKSATLADTSIGISLDVIKRVRDTLTSSLHGMSDIRFRALYIEKDAGRFAQLEKHLSLNVAAGIETHCMKGDFSDLQDEILAYCEGGFAFFFLDPKGWTHVAPKQFLPMLARPNSEFMITFMYDFLNRAVGMDAMRQQVLDILGSATCVDEIRAGVHPDRELIIVKHYAEYLKSHMSRDAAKPRAFFSTILDKKKNRTKYHMVYLTYHPKGIVEFARQTEKTQILQRKIRIHQRATAGAQELLIPIEDHEPHDPESVDYDKVKEYLLGTIGNSVKVFDEAALADMIEATGWLESVFQTAFERLINDGSIENLDTQGKRRKRFVHFDQCERVRRKNGIE